MYVWLLYFICVWIVRYRNGLKPPLIFTTPTVSFWSCRRYAWGQQQLSFPAKAGQSYSIFIHSHSYIKITYYNTQFKYQPFYFSSIVSFGEKYNYNEKHYSAKENSVRGPFLIYKVQTIIIIQSQIPHIQTSVDVFPIAIFQRYSWLSIQGGKLNLLEGSGTNQEGIQPSHWLDH